MATSNDVPKPFWEPTYQLQQVLEALEVKPTTNWACPTQGNNMRPSHTASYHLGGVLSDQDVRMLSDLRLNSKLHSPLVCAIFKDLMRALPAAQRPGRAVQRNWIDLLLSLTPPANHGRPAFNSAPRCAEEQIDRGNAELLLPLYMLLLRSDAWISQIQLQIYGRLQPLRPLPDEIARAYDPQVLIGDPCSTDHTVAGRWTPELMEAREIFFCSDEVDGVQNSKIQDLLFSLDVMTRVVATCTPLESRIEGYDYWSCYLSGR